MANSSATEKLTFFLCVFFPGEGGGVPNFFQKKNLEVLMFLASSLQGPLPVGEVSRLESVFSCPILGMQGSSIGTVIGRRRDFGIRAQHFMQPRTMHLLSLRNCHVGGKKHLDA